MTVYSTTKYISTGVNCIIGSNIHHVPASQADNDQFGTGVHVAYFFTIYNHAIEGIRVDNNLCVDV